MSTSRKGVTYYPAVSTTRLGKIRHAFVRTPKVVLAERIPEGFKISESVNGVVSLVKSRPAEILESEIASVNDALRCHPQASRYQACVKRNTIDVYGQSGSTAEDLAGLLQPIGTSRAAIQEFLDRSLPYTPVMRFVLIDAERRLFMAERMCYRGETTGCRWRQRAGSNVSPSGWCRSSARMGSSN
jgi:hypothetical protein